MHRPKKTKPTAVTAAGETEFTRVEEPDPPTPPESAPTPPPAHVPAAAPTATPQLVHAAAQQKKRGRPPDTWLQIEEKKLKRMEAAYLSAERDRVAKIEEHDQYLERTYGHTLHWPEPQMPPQSLEKRFQEKMEKRQRKVNELESAWLQAVEKFEAEKLRRAVDQGRMLARELIILHGEHRLLQLNYELAETKRQLAEASQAEAEAALAVATQQR